MAEAVVALSLAANILQVVEYGSEFVGVAWKIWKSGRDGIEGLTALQALSQNLKEVSQQLQVEHPSTRQAASEKGICDLARECSRTAQEILDSLEKIGLQTNGRKRDAAKAAFKLAWAGDSIRALQARFGEFRNQLTLNLAASLR